MAIFKQNTHFNESGLNSDVDKKYMPPGNSDHILNDIISFIDGKAGSRTNVKGNKPINNFGSGYSFIGHVKDVERNSIIFFLHHTGGNHSIVSYNVVDKTITSILINKPILNFSTDRLILHANIVGDLLYWVDIKPYKVNIKKAISYTAKESNTPSGLEEEQYINISEDIITAAKKPPLKPVVLRNGANIADAVSETMVSNGVVNTSVSLKTNTKYHAGAFIDSVIDDGSSLESVKTTLKISIIRDSDSSVILSKQFDVKVPGGSTDVELVNSGGLIFESTTTGQHTFRVEYTTTAYDAGGTTHTGSLNYHHSIRNVVTAEGSTFTGVGYQDDSTLKYNSLREKQCQFAYRFLYDDKEKSIFSPLSEVLIPNGEESVGGFISGNQEKNNRIDFLFETGSEIVDGIEIAVKVGELGAWHSYQILNKKESKIPNDCMLKYSFLNDRTSIPLDEKLVNITSNFSPLEAETQEYLTSNELAYGRVTEGFDNISTDIDLRLNSAEYTYNPVFTNMEVREEKVTSFDIEYHFIVLKMPTTKYTGKDYIVSVELTSGEKTFLTVPDDWSTIDDYPTKMVDAIVAKIKDAGINTAAPKPWTYTTHGSVKVARGGIVGGDLSFDVASGEVAFLAGTRHIWDFQPPINNLSYVSGAVVDFSITTQDKLRTYHHGMYNVGIKYTDQYGRKSSVQTTDDTNIFVHDRDHANMNTIKTIEYDIKHKPPVWATKYQMCVTKNLSQISSMQWTIDSAVKETRLGIDYGIIGINRSIVGMRDLIPKFAVEPYVFKKGDKLRLVGEYDEGGQRWARSINYNYFDILGVEFDNPKKKAEYAYDEVDKEFKKEDVDLIDEQGNVVYDDHLQKLIIQVNAADLNSGIFTNDFRAGVVVEIVTPANVNEDNFFFEVGDVYDIGNPGQPDRYHKGQTQDQAYSPSLKPAKGVLDEGDFVWRIRYDLFKGLDFPCIDSHASDFYKSSFAGLGKVGVEDKESEQKTYNIIRHSGKYFDNTNINDLNLFDSGDYVALNDKHGPITKTIMVGDALKVFQPKKVTSIYIGKTFTKLADGTNQLIAIDKTFGTVNPSPLDFGSINPESVLRNKRFLYFYDLYNGAFVRDAPNGPITVSDYKMKGYFESKTKALLKSGIGNFKVITGYDEENDLVCVTFLDSVNPANNETVAFYEDGNSWQCFFSFIPDMYADLGINFITAKNSSIYIHNDETAKRCEFYGTKYAREFKVYCNQEPEITKTFFSLSIFTNKNGWYSPEITIEPTPTYLSGMLSKLEDWHFKGKEGVLYAPFLRNILTLGNEDPAIKLINGDQLRGETVGILLKEENDTECVLREVDINYTK